MTTATIQITEPGVYDLDADTYHADPVPGGSLSSTGARHLLPPSCPALFDYDRKHPRPPKPHFEFGHALHREVLGEGPDNVVVDARDWKTNAAKKSAEEIRAEGKTPLLPHEHAKVLAMAAALREHPVAGALLKPGSGAAEKSLFWTDRATGVKCRARLDWLRHKTSKGGKLYLPDLKSCNSADTESLRKAIHTYGYHQQGDWYEAAVRALGIAEDPVFVLIGQEKTPPYLVNVVQPDQKARRIAAYLNREARELYAECEAAGRWPGYSDDIQPIALPRWVEREYEEPE